MVKAAKSSQQEAYVLVISAQGNLTRWAQKSSAQAKSFMAAGKLERWKGTSRLFPNKVNALKATCSTIRSMVKPGIETPKETYTEVNSCKTRSQAKAALFTEMAIATPVNGKTTCFMAKVS